MSADTKLACNRLPFQTDDSCSRGDVDITVFKDLPICLPINPTEPKGGVPQTDIPVIPITPPPCACVNIDMSGSGKVENRKGVDVKTEFKSVGDCCEGNYKANVKVNIPCIPFGINDADRDQPIDIVQGCDIREASGTFNPGLKVEDCNITVNPKLRLRIPTPAKVDIQPKLTINTSCRADITGTFTIKKGGDQCNTIFTPTLTLNVPKIPHFSACPTGTVNMTGGLGGTGIIDMGRELDECGNTKLICPRLDLNIPCPLPQEIKFHAKIDWKKDRREQKNIIIAKKKGSCSLEIPQPTVELGLPCPLPNDITTTTKVSWNDDREPKTVTLLRKVDSCTIAPPTQGLELSIPCPVKFPEPVKTRIHVQFVQSVAGNYDVSASILDHDPDPQKCGFSVKNNQITLRIPTGGGGGGGGVCPVWVSDVKFDLSRGAGLRLIKVYTDCDGNQWEEEGSKLGMKEISVVSASKYSDGTFKNTKKTVWVLDSEDALDEDVFYAVEHACCD